MQIIKNFNSTKFVSNKFVDGYNLNCINDKVLKIQTITERFKICFMKMNQLINYSINQPSFYKWLSSIRWSFKRL